MIEKIFFDMDGVLADFDLGVKELCNLPIKEQGQERTKENDDLMWGKIKEVEHFFDKLKPMPEALDMFHKIYEKYGDKCEILTGIPKPKRGITTAGEDKTNWIHRLISDKIKVNIVLREQKKLYCKGKNYILIDDLLCNINDWETSGGTGILHKNPQDTLNQLKKIEESLSI